MLQKHLVHQAAKWHKNQFNFGFIKIHLIQSSCNHGKVNKAKAGATLNTARPQHWKKDQST